MLQLPLSHRPTETSLLQARPAHGGLLSALDQEVGFIGHARRVTASSFSTLSSVPNFGREEGSRCSAT